jgi:hypothetical protein
MSSKWKCLSQEEAPFLPFVPGDTLNILIDMMLIFRRQESPEAFVTLTTVAGVIRRPVRSGLETGCSQSLPSLVCVALHAVTAYSWKEFPFLIPTYYLHGDLAGLWEAPCSFLSYEKLPVTLLPCLQFHQFRELFG